MKCPRCGNIFSEKRVTHSSVYEAGYRIRRRVCSQCGNVFKTVELPVDDFGVYPLGPTIRRFRSDFNKV